MAIRHSQAVKIARAQNANWISRPLAMMVSAAQFLHTVIPHGSSMRQDPPLFALSLGKRLGNRILGGTQNATLEGNCEGSSSKQGSRIPNFGGSQRAISG